MIAQYIQLGNRGWNVLIYYYVEPEDFIEVRDSLEQIGCSEKHINKALRVLRRKNTGLTYTDTDQKMSIVCISHTTNVEQFVNTCIHEAKHVQSHVCEYYDIDEDSETAAYLIGHLVQQMYKMLVRILRQYLT